MSEYLQQLAFVSMPGGGEWLIILVVGLLIFGRRLPEVARNLGKTVNEFKRGLRDFQETAEDAARDAGKIGNEVASEVKNATSGVEDYNSYGDGSYGDGSYGDGSYGDGSYGDGSTDTTDTTAEETGPVEENAGSAAETVENPPDEVATEVKDAGAEPTSDEPKAEPTH